MFISHMISLFRSIVKWLSH